jgi:hypothetical protein
MLDAQRTGSGITGAGVSGQCNVGAFQGSTGGGYDRSNDAVSIARAKVNEAQRHPARRGGRCA